MLSTATDGHAFWLRDRKGRQKPPEGPRSGIVPMHAPATVFAPLARDNAAVNAPRAFVARHVVDAVTVPASAPRYPDSSTFR